MGDGFRLGLVPSSLPRVSTLHLVLFFLKVVVFFYCLISSYVSFGDFFVQHGHYRSPQHFYYHGDFLL